MRLTNAADYAIRAMVHIACLPEGGMSLRSEIAQCQEIPSSFMAKILRRLVQARLLRSSRGVNGGFTLARPGAEISLLDMVEAIEGPLAISNCASHPEGCTWSNQCPGSLVWPIVQEKLQETLGSITLEDLVSTRRQNGGVAAAGSNGETPEPELKLQGRAAGTPFGTIATISG
jgi:Rrf2 family protein